MQHAIIGNAIKYWLRVQTFSNPIVSTFRKFEHYQQMCWSDAARCLIRFTRSDFGFNYLCCASLLNLKIGIKRLPDGCVRQHFSQLQLRRSSTILSLRSSCRFPYGLAAVLRHIVLPSCICMLTSLRPSTLSAPSTRRASLCFLHKVPARLRVLPLVPELERRILQD